MASETVLNHFKQTPGPLGDGDNEFVVGGTVSSPGGAILNVVRFTGIIEDMSANKVVAVASPGFAGTITKVTAASDGDLTSGSVSVSFQNAGTPMTGGGVTLNAAYQSQSNTPTTFNGISGNGIVDVVINVTGPPPAAASITTTVEITPS